VSGAFRVYKLGGGVLRWPPDDVAEDAVDPMPFLWEQSIGLMGEGNRWITFASAPIGSPVVLCATVTALRGPMLPEDPDRQICTTRPYVGETVTLATGALFTCDAFGGNATGIGAMPLGPLQGTADWIDRARLYRVHNHVVELRAIELRPPGRKSLLRSPKQVRERCD
jgi:hypothetical protein